MTLVERLQWESPTHLIKVVLDLRGWRLTLIKRYLTLQACCGMLQCPWHVPLTSVVRVKLWAGLGPVATCHWLAGVVWGSRGTSFTWTLHAHPATTSYSPLNRHFQNWPPRLLLLGPLLLGLLGSQCRLWNLLNLHIGPISFLLRHKTWILCSEIRLKTHCYSDFSCLGLSQHVYIRIRDSLSIFFSMQTCL